MARSTYQQNRPVTGLPTPVGAVVTHAPAAMTSAPPVVGRIEFAAPMEPVPAAIPYFTAVTQVTPVGPATGIVDSMDGSVGDLHAVQQRLAEIVPFLPGARAQAHGPVKTFLDSLSASL